MRTKLKSCTFAFVVFATSFLYSCSSNDNPIEDESNEQQKENQVVQDERPKARVDIELTEAEKQLSQQSADFSIRLLQVAHKTFADSSQIILSPLSASYALSMVNNGAAGDTQQEILGTLGFKGFNTNEVNAFNKKLMVQLAELDNTSIISIANSLWLNKGFNTKETFKNTLENNYEAKVGTVDFSKAETKEQINNWCEEKTNGCIKNFLDELSPSYRFVLLNALYFKGRWAEQFKATEKGTFITEKGQQQEVTFMLKKKAWYLYTESEKFEMAELPYGNEAFGMVVIVPKKESDITDCISALTGTKWLEAVNNMRVTCLNLKLPKFKVENKQSLIHTLKEMGIVKAFTNEADFSALSENNVFISEVLQANHFSVDENGTEASAVTGIFGDLSSAGTEIEVKAIDFPVDRPFLYFIKEKSTNSILFMGKVGSI